MDATTPRMRVVVPTVMILVMRSLDLMVVLHFVPWPVAPSCALQGAGAEPNHPSRDMGGGCVAGDGRVAGDCMGGRRGCRRWRQSLFVRGSSQTVFACNASHIHNQRSHVSTSASAQARVRIPLPCTGARWQTLEGQRPGYDPLRLLLSQATQGPRRTKVNEGGRT